MTPARRPTSWAVTDMSTEKAARPLAALRAATSAIALFLRRCLVGQLQVQLRHFGGAGPWTSASTRATVLGSVSLSKVYHFTDAANSAARLPSISATLNFRRWSDVGEAAGREDRAVGFQAPGGLRSVHAVHLDHRAARGAAGVHEQASDAGARADLVGVDRMPAAVL